MEDDSKTCFIIMPIRTPENSVETYRDREAHFTHVLECLFVPAVESAGFTPIPPTSKGSDLIQAAIIKNLENSNIVLCDMSCLNPNVFFEFGIRASLNKPVCVVKDEHTKNVPFDTGILNYQEYKSSLDPWELAAEVKKLSEHIKASYERSKGENTLWHYFGLREKAQPYQGETGIDSSLQLLSLQMDSLRDLVSKIGQETDSNTNSLINYPVIFKRICEHVRVLLPKDANLHSWVVLPDEIGIKYGGEISNSEMLNISKAIYDEFGIGVSFSKIFPKQKSEQKT